MTSDSKDNHSASSGVLPSSNPLSNASGGAPTRRRGSSAASELRKKDPKEKRTELMSILDENPVIQINGDDIMLDNMDEIKSNSEEEIDVDNFEDVKVFEEIERVKKAIEKGIDIRQYSKEIEEDLRQVEISSIDDYLREGERLAQLHGQLQQCDAIFEKLEEMLKTFQESIGNISEEINYLQDESFSMNIKLKNRQSVEKELLDFINQIVLPDKLISDVCDSNVSDQYLDSLLTLNQKVDFVQSLVQEKRVRGQVYHVRPLASQDVEPALFKLVHKACTKIRVFLLKKIAELKKSYGSSQLLKQNELLRYKFFEEFLEKHNPEYSNDIKNAYIDTMSRHYFSNMKTFIQQLQKLETKVGTKSAVIVGSKPSVSLFGTAKPISNRATFVIGNRKNILEHLDEVSCIPITPHAEQEKGTKFTFEAIFKSILLALVNTASAEYIFLVDFFPSPQFQIFQKTPTDSTDRTLTPASSAGNISSNATTPANSTPITTPTISPSNSYNDFTSTEQITKMFGLTFKQVISLIEQVTEGFISTSYDAIGLLLMIQIAYAFKQIMCKRGIYCLNQFYDQILSSMYNRFKMIIELNLQSITNAIPQTLLPIERNSHATTKRFAEFNASLTCINRDGPYKQAVETCLEKLRQSMEKLIFQISEQFGTVTPNTPAALVQELSKQKTIYLINALDIILHSLFLHGIEIKDDDRFHQLLEQRIATYVQLELNECYSRLISFTQQTEPLVSKNHSHTANKNRVNTGEMENVAKDFGKNWKAGLEHINDNVTRNFSNLKTGMVILRQCFLELLSIYSKFYQLVYACYPNPPFRQSLVGNQMILHEIKQYSKDF